MKKLFATLLMTTMIFAITPAISVFAQDEVYQENVIDKISDWAQTIGKDPAERDRILAQRKTERQRKHMEKRAEQMKRRAGKKAGDMKKGLGL